MKTRKFGWLPLTAVTVVLSLGPGNGCATDDPGFRQKPSLVADADKLQSTSFTAHLQVPIEPGKNVLWCATFQLAWNQACELAGGELKFAPPKDGMIDILNRKSVSPSDLDDASYVAVAGYVRDGIYSRINELLKTKFNGSARPALLPDSSVAARPQDLVAYCYLYKELDFPTPFERAPKPLAFDGTTVVDCFGMGEFKPGREEMAKGISILDYQSPDDFVIELQSKSPQDHLILAKIAPQATLADTIALVRLRIQKAAPVPAAASDILVVPKFNFDLTRHYKELMGLHLIPTAPGMADDLQILAADQSIRFLMDEKGVQLRSESNMSFGCSAEAVPQPLHRMVFDKPFLLLLSREGSKSPYFALWVDNAELLEKADR